MNNQPEVNTVEDYICSFIPEIREKLNLIRFQVLEVVPEATEIISYGIPTFRLKKNLIHFAAYKNHIAIYPGPAAVEHFAGELKEYKTSKGTIQFPLNGDIPIGLIKKIVEYLVEKLHA